MAKHNDQLPPGRLMPAETELSPLDQIRQSEAEIIRLAAAARQTAVHSLDTARKEAARLVAQAREDGQREGQARYQETLQAAEREAKHIVDLAQAQVNERSRVGTQRKEMVVEQIVDLITGTVENTSTVKSTGTKKV